MKHRFLKTAMAAFFACTAISVSAANPFADVAEDSWAYQAVAQLSDQGVIDGYPDGTFRGDKNVSRYELAQIIARLMAKEDALNQEQQATVAKLAQEYNQDLANLGVRVTELEKKTGNTELITELRVQSVDRYDNIFTGEKKNEISARVRLNTISRVNDRSTVYGQLETTMGMNGTDPYDVNKLDPKARPNENTVRSGYGDGELHMNRLWATYHFGPKQSKEKQPYGPSKNLIGIGQFPVKMGVTGYTYDGQFKGAFVSFGDYQQGGRFTVAYGRATDINYQYTGPMMRGIPMDQLIAAVKKGNNTKLKETIKKLEPFINNPQTRDQAYSRLAQGLKVNYGLDVQLANGNIYPLKDVQMDCRWPTLLISIKIPASGKFMHTA